MNNIKLLFRLTPLLLILFLFMGCSQGEKNKRGDRRDVPQSVKKKGSDSTKEQYQRMKIDTLSIQKNLTQLCVDIRSTNAEKKEESRIFIEDKLKEYNYTPKRQKFDVFSPENNNFAIFPGDSASDFFQLPKTKTAVAGTGANIIAENQYNSAKKKTIYITAHYDTTSITTGVLDNGTGVAVVLEAAKALQKYKGEFNLTFVLFDTEELNQQGARHFVKELSVTEKENVIACLNFDMVGLKESDSVVMYLGKGEPNIVSLAWNQVLSKQMETCRASLTDEVPFYYGEIPAVTFISKNPLSYDHKEADQFQYVDYEKLNEITNDLCDFIERLDYSAYQKPLKENKEINSQLKDVYDLQNADYQRQYVALRGNGAVPETVVIYKNKQGKEFKVSMRAGSFFDQDKLEEFREINTASNTDAQPLYYSMKLEEALVEYYNSDWYGTISGNLTEDEYIQILGDLYNASNQYLLTSP